MTPEDPFPLADVSLARRLERAEGRGCAEFVEARAALFPDGGARWIEVAGALAMYDGVASPITQTFGLGLFEKITPADLDRIEEFYRQFQAPVYHEVSPLADASLWPLLSERGYHPFEFTSVLYRPLRPGVRAAGAVNDRIGVRLVRGDERESWTRTSAKGWSEAVELGGMILELAQINFSRPGALCFAAELGGEAIATGALFVSEGVALLAGASTIPEGRKQGAQLALLDARLRYAAEHGCDLAMMGALPGSGSQRNAERQGFRIAYTRIKWRLRPATSPAP
jgi:hypothetical protein